MVKITRSSTPERSITRLRVEGRIVSRCASEIATACHDALAEGAPVVLDLGGVAFIDAAGAAAIAALERRDVTVIGCSSFIAALLRSHAERDDGIARDDAPLVRRLQRSEPGAFEAMVRRHGPRLLATARRLSPNEAAARAAVRRAFVAAARDVPTLLADARLDVALRRLVVRAALAPAARRRAATAPPIERPLPRFDERGRWAAGGGALPTLPGDAARRPEVRDVVRRSVTRLPEPFRTTLVLCEVEELDPGEIAVLLATTAAAVRQRLHQARHALQALLAEALARDGAAADADAADAAATPESS